MAHLQMTLQAKNQVEVTLDPRDSGILSNPGSGRTRLDFWVPVDTLFKCPTSETQWNIKIIEIQTDQIANT